MEKVSGILIINKNNRERRLLKTMIKADECAIFDTPNALEALNIIRKEDIRVVIANKEIDGMESSEFKAIIEKIQPGINVIFTQPFTKENKEISINADEFMSLIQNYVKNESSLKRDLADIKQFSFALADRLLQIFEVNDRYFFNNDHLVADLSRKIAMRMNLEESLIESIQMAALLRDLGKIGIQHQLLEGTKRLNQTELTPIKEHPLHTMQILRQIKFPWNLDTIISQHHERYDGAGYPMGLKGREITIGARIISVIDAYCSMTTDRPYRKALSREAAVQEITKNAGSQFDPEVVEVFLAVIKEEPSEIKPKKNILIFERDPNIAALIKLIMTADEMDVVHAVSSIDALVYVRQKNPDLILADVESLEPDAFMRFYNAVQRISTVNNRRFLFITPDDDYPKNFNGNVDYISKPLNISKLTAKIKKLLFEPLPLPQQQEEARGLTGNLDEFSLTDIIQILSLGIKTAKVEVAKGLEKGTLYLLHGKIVYASAGSLKGPEAFYELISWNNGTFCILHGQVTSETNITIDTMRLMFEASSALDEKRVHKNPPTEKISA